MKNEFYADLMANDLQKIVFSIRKILRWVLICIFLIVFLGLFFQSDKMNDYLHTLENTLTSNFSFQETTLVLVLPVILLLGMSSLVFLVKMIRKFWLFPKSAFTDMVIATVQSKERVHHRRDTNSYYVTVHHPYTQKTITFEIDRNNYEKLNQGDKVHIHGHPAETNIFYMTTQTSLLHT